MKHENLIFSTIVYPDTSVETDVVLLVESIRAFAGSLAQVPIWCFVPQYAKDVTPVIADRLHALGVTLIRFEIEQPATRFPFVADARAGALAEARAEKQTDILVWFSANTLVLREPTDLILPRNKHLAYRPVHHTLIGSPYDELPDRFWTLVYKHCKVPDDRIFPMKTHVDGKIIRPYFNAGILVLRPMKKLLQSWRDTFFDTYQKDEFCSLYERDKRYTIFMHQAILSGVILSRYQTDQLQELPHTYNYPLHLHDDDVTRHRPAVLEELVTVRHEGFYKNPAWYAHIPAGEHLKQWLKKTLGTGINF